MLANSWLIFDVTMVTSQVNKFANSWALVLRSEVKFPNRSPPGSLFLPARQNFL